MLEDVAMPYVLSRVSIEPNDDASDHPCLSTNRSLPTHFVCVRWHGRPGELEFALAQIIHDIKILPVKNLKAHHVKMDRMGIFRPVDQTPDFSGPEQGIFANRV